MPLIVQASPIKQGKQFMASIQAHLINLVLKLTGRRKRFESLPAFQAELDRTRRADNLPRDPFPRVTLTGDPLAEGSVITLTPPKPGLLHILYLHGGAWVFPPRSPHWDFLSRLCDETGATITMPLYPLGPGADHDTMMAMLEPLYGDLRRAFPKLAVMGDSAGAGLALSLLQAGMDAPDRLVLISPPVDLAMTNPALPAAAKRDPMLALPALRQIGEWYRGARPLDDPRISPLHMDMALLPPTLAFMGTRDLLHPDMMLFLDRAGDAPLDYIEGRGMIHVWPLLNALPEARAARARILSFLGS